MSTTWRNLSPSARVAVRIRLFPLVGSAAIPSTWKFSSLFMQKHEDGLRPPPSRQTNHRGCDRQLQDFTSSTQCSDSFSLSNDSKSMTTVLLSLPFRSTDRPNHSSISSVEVNRRHTFTEVDNTVVSLTSGQDHRSFTGA
ncbi:hypothetical protein BHE74_00010791 [Ensete ventricosum]|nr:hypothetical protein BHE74_00010791 [Ensete ventricosum]